MNTLYEAASTGSRMDALIQLRDHLAQAIDNNPPARDLASLSRQFVLVLEAIAAEESGEPRKGSEIDDLLDDNKAEDRSSLPSESAGDRGR